MEKAKVYFSDLRAQPGNESRSIKLQKARSCAPA
jgi:hypothetical protein